MIIEENIFFDIKIENDLVFLQMKKAGFPIKKFDSILKNHPRLKLHSFSSLKKALENVSDTFIEIGTWLPLIQIDIDNDHMRAFAIINEVQKNIILKEESLKVQLIDEAKRVGITFGYKEPKLTLVKSCKPFLIAEGAPPEKGQDALITYIEIPERKPIIKDDGNADYYEMNFIFEVEENDWLGEKIFPLNGVNGKTVLGEAVFAEKGQDLPLLYDLSSAYESEENNKIVLRASKSGALDIKAGLLTIHDHLVIDGDVGVETGNIEFNGSLTVKGTVLPGYSVLAANDVEIQSNEGILNADLIKSTDGSIYIRGGVFGKEKTSVEAGIDIFIKHANDCFLTAKNTIHIGFYSIGSEIRANSIIFDGDKGKIIGGKAEALFQIITAYSGNRLDRKTELTVLGVNKEQLLAEIQIKALELKDLQKNIEEITEKNDLLETYAATLTSEQNEVYEKSKTNLDELKQQFRDVDEEIQASLYLMKNAKNEEIQITKGAYPNTIIRIGSHLKVLSKLSVGTIKVEDGVLNI